MYHARRLIFITIWVSLCGCAYNYAGQEGKNRQKRPDPDNVEVVSVEKNDAGSDSEELSDDLPTDPVEPDQAPCGVDRFTVQQFAADGMMRKTLACRSSDVVDVARVPLSDHAFQQMKNDGYPPGKWYIVVEPRSVAEGVLNNDHLLQMSREYELDFFGRVADTDKLVYLFLSPVP